MTGMNGAEIISIALRTVQHIYAFSNKPIQDMIKRTVRDVYYHSGIMPILKRGLPDAKKR